ncbi:uncharacterized protein F4822DRAFT_433404 [Hypoxylon trugodes]|uniref:uncharacterized protein n=1 Tax=Hypoxylon trugodes TaxID=326681 RepID=UPI00219FDAA4|nr:uncharacterized protein F4822DRAFT_433404 [Hypoxylon trugodes]KAI1384865.1 hypothetical protein F4822DRAFT_433404 [Hypoxylon trugodes]
MPSRKVVSFDLTGAGFAKSLTPPPRGPESRSDKYSFFKEISQEQLSSYTPSQVCTILAQREEVLRESQEASSSTDPPPGFDHLRRTKPWVPSEADECKYKCCQRCRPSAEWRSYLSLDGIVNGDVPPTAATGFSFYRTGRPVIHPDRLKNIGLRAVPWPRARKNSHVSSLSSLTSLNCSSISDERETGAEHIEFSDRQSLEGSSTTESLVLGHHPSNDNNAVLPPWPRSSDPSKENTKPTLFAAYLTPLPLPTPGEEEHLDGYETQMMKDEKEKGEFFKEPLEVDHGVALSEEGVGLGLPDIVVTQV